MRPFLYPKILGLILCATFPGLLSAQLVDRILAVVNNEVIALSDVQKYQTLFRKEDDTNDILKELIDQKLILAEAKKFEIPPPPEEAVQKESEKLMTRLGGEAALEELLKRIILSEAEVRELIQARLTVQQILEERINFFIFVSPREVDAYYQAHAGEFDGLSPDEARGAIQKQLTQSKTKTKREDYLDRLRKRAKVRIH